MPHRQPGGAVVIVPIVGQTKVLLIEELTKPEPRYWKFVSETFEPGDTMLDALVRGVAQEAGLTDLAVQLDHENKHVRKIIDPRVLWQGPLAPVEGLTNDNGPQPIPFKRHFQCLRTVDAVVDALSGKILVTKGEREKTRTQSFFLHALNNPDFIKNRFLPQQRALLEKIPELQAA